MKLQIRSDLPEGFLDAAPTELQGLLGGPSLIHLPGERAGPLLVSTLLHGNETTGFLALQAFLRRHLEHGLPRALSLFIGNVAAAQQGLRVLPGQADFNRIWPDAQGEAPANADRETASIAQRVVGEMRERAVFAVLDLHNTSGRNPPHACVNGLQAENLALAAGFAHRVLYFTRPAGVLAMAFTGHCPAVTVECGPVGTDEGLQLTGNYLDYVIGLDSAETLIAADTAMQLYRSVARVEVAGEGGPGALKLVEGLDGYNWRELAPGTVLASTEADLERVLRVTDPEGLDVTGLYLEHRQAEIVTRQAITPAMLTTDPDIIRQDCLCYFLERVC